MSYVLAIDVGTTFTAAAVLRIDQKTPAVPESLPLGLRGTAVPSVVYYPEEGPLLVGEAAERRGLDSPERVVREFKRRVGDEVPIAVGTMMVAAQDVFAAVARWVVDRAEEREGAPPSDIVLTHPASWGGHRTSMVRAALKDKGLHNVTLISEPEAAALHYAAQDRVSDGTTLAVYDLGGGTFDAAVLRKKDARSFEFLGRPDGLERLGGADFDAFVLQHVVAHTGTALEGLDHEAPGVRAALARLQRECVEAKEALSADSEATIPVLLPGDHQQVRLVRAEFEALIEEAVRETVDVLERLLETLGLVPDELSAVLLIGGSSRIPLVAQLISSQLNRPIVVDADPKASICLGAARATLGLPATAGSLVPEHVQTAEAGAVGADDPVDVAAHGDSPSGVAARASASTSASPRRRPRVRFAAVAVAAALFTGLTATAAQSPEGLGGLAALFGEQEAGSGNNGSKEEQPPNPGSGTVPGMAGDAQGTGETGIEKAASSTRTDTTGAPSGTAQDGGTAPGESESGESGQAPTTPPALPPPGTAAGAEPGTGGSGTPSDSGSPQPTIDSEPQPTTDPTVVTPDPTPEPTPEPTVEPTLEPTVAPTVEPTEPGTTQPSDPAPLQSDPVVPVEESPPSEEPAVAAAPAV